jgi:hypothetical protein
MKLKIAGSNQFEFSLSLAVLFWHLLLLAYSFACGVLFDHKHYVEQWQLMLSGGDPWSTDNTYGPLHNVIGYLYLLDPLAPKMLIVGALLVANLLLVDQLLKLRGASISFLPYLLAVPANVLVLGMGIVFGLNDALVAAFLVFAVILRIRDLNSLAGIAIGLAALMKFYPLLLLPFFALEAREKRDNQGLNWSLILSGSFVFALGIIGAYLTWGSGIFRVISTGAERGASLMSILVDLSRWGWNGPIVIALSKYNALFVFAGAGFVFALAFFKRVLWLEAAVLGYLSILMIYKVGHQQFFIPWLFLVAALPLLKTPTSDRLAFTMIPMAIYLSIFHFAFDLGSNLMGNRAEWVEWHAGTISFPIELLSLIAGLIATLKTQSRRSI